MRNFALTVSVRTIVSTQYLPMQSAVDPSSREKLHRQLSDWEYALPHELKLDNAESSRGLFLTGLLHMTHWCVACLPPTIPLLTWV